MQNPQTPLEIDALFNLIAQYVLDNTAGRITPADMRQVLGAMVTDARLQKLRLDELTTNQVKGSVFRVPYVVLVNGVPTVNTLMLPPRMRILGMDARAVNGTDAVSALAGVRADPIDFRLLAHSVGTVNALVDEKPATVATAKAHWVRTSGTDAEKKASFPVLVLSNQTYLRGDVVQHTFPSGQTLLLEWRADSVGAQHPVPTGLPTDFTYKPFAPLSTREHTQNTDVGTTAGEFRLRLDSSFQAQGVVGATVLVLEGQQGGPAAAIRYRFQDADNSPAAAFEQCFDYTGTAADVWAPLAAAAGPARFTPWQPGGDPGYKQYQLLRNSAGVEFYPKNTLINPQAEPFLPTSTAQANNFYQKVRADLDAALGNDPSFSLTVANALAAKASRVAGKVPISELPTATVAQVVAGTAGLVVTPDTLPAAGYRPGATVHLGDWNPNNNRLARTGFSVVDNENVKGSEYRITHDAAAPVTLPAAGSQSQPGNYAIAVATTANIGVGHTVTGAGIPAGARVLEVFSANTLIIDRQPNVTMGEPLTFAPKIGAIIHFKAGDYLVNLGPATTATNAPNVWATRPGLGVGLRSGTVVEFDQDADYPELFSGTFTVNLATRLAGRTVKVLLAAGCSEPVLTDPLFDKLGGGAFTAGAGHVYLFSTSTATGRVQYVIGKRA